MTMFVINARPLSDALTTEQKCIRQNVEGASQTIERLKRMLLRAEKAAIRGNENAKRDLCALNDSLYTTLAEMALDESSWEK